MIRHEKFKAPHDSPIGDFSKPAQSSSPDNESLRRMAATWTRDNGGLCRSQIAINPGAAAFPNHRKCGQLGGTAMITVSIFWALVFALFITKTEQPKSFGSKR
jgi:hypothetical protein